MHQTLCFRTILFFSFLLYGVPLFAQLPAKVVAAPMPAAEKGSPRSPKIMSLTISGGVSLGAYEAGFLFYLTELNKKNKLTQFPVITGASAGALNGFLTAVAQCDLPEKDYENSLFWKFWIPMGIDKLSEGDSHSSHALLSRESTNRQIGEIKDHIKKMTPTQCESILGVMLTRKNPMQMALTDELSVPKLSESFLFKLSTDPNGGATGGHLRFENLPLKRYQGHQFRLAFNGNFDHDFALIAKVFSASSAFPVAFNAEKVSYCLEKSTDHPGTCTDEDTIEDEFIDGGLYDNQPLRSAVIAANDKIGKNIPILLLDPTLYDAPVTAAKVEKVKDQPLVPYMTEIASSLINSARISMISRLLEEDPSIVKRIYHSTAKLPLNSAGLDAFIGFFEADFRKTDFIFGMSEAKRFSHKYFGSSDHMIYPEANNTVSWKKFKCMNEILDGGRSVSPGCHFLFEEENLNSLILLQVSLDRLYENCKAIHTKIPFAMNHCIQAQKGETAPNLFEAPREHFIKKQENEADFTYFFRLLSNYEFKYTDLGLQRNEAAYGLHRINQKMFTLAKRIANKQEQPERALIKMMAKPMLNALTTYTPVDSMIYVNVGTTEEIGWSQLIYRKKNVQSPFQYTLGLRTQGVTTLFDSNAQFAFTPFIGGDIDIAPWNGPVTQFRAGLQLGRIFGSDDRWGTRSCTPGATGPVGWACSGWVVVPTFTFSFLDRFRVQTEFLINPLFNQQPPFQVTLQLGYQFLLD
jgi:predicted acylesterase/phospholipase RssA